MRCRYLLSEDLHNGQVVDGLTIVSPFTHQPDEAIERSFASAMCLRKRPSISAVPKSLSLYMRPAR